MIESYDILFSVSFMHDYYRNGRCNDISVVPDEYSQFLIKKNGLIFRTTNTGFTILVKSKKDNNEKLISESVDTNLQLNFRLTFSNPYLPNITDISLPEGNQTHLFSNTLVEASAKDSSSFSFSIGNSTRFINDLIISDDVLNGKNQLEKGGEVFTLNSKENTEPVKYILKGLDPGVYQQSAEETKRYFYLSSKVLALQIFAILSIDLQRNNITDDAGKMLHPNYALHLHARKTYWQYIITKKDKQDNLVIDTSDKSDMFEKSEDELAGGQQVIIFTSKEEIPVGETREEYFRLKLRNGDPSNDLILISKLPVPDMGVLNRIEKGKIYTPIYVNY